MALDLLPLYLRLLPRLCFRLLVNFSLLAVILSPAIDVFAGLYLFLVSRDSLSRCRVGLLLRGFLAFCCRVWLILGAASCWENAFFSLSLVDTASLALSAACRSLEGFWTPD